MLTFVLLLVFGVVVFQGTESQVPSIGSWDWWFGFGFAQRVLKSKWDFSPNSTLEAINIINVHVLVQFVLLQNIMEKRKLMVLNALIASQETLEPTDAAANLLNTFQLKGLRKTLKLHTTYKDRTATSMSTEE